MPDDDKARTAAQELRVKELVKEAISEWQTEAETTRTAAEGNKKKSTGFFDNLFGA